MFGGSGLVSALGGERARRADKRQARGKAARPLHNARSRSTSKDTAKGRHVAQTRFYATVFPARADRHGDGRERSAGSQALDTAAMIGAVGLRGTAKGSSGVVVGWPAALFPGATSRSLFLLPLLPLLVTSKDYQFSGQKKAMKCNPLQNENEPNILVFSGSEGILARPNSWLITSRSQVQILSPPLFVSLAEIRL